LAVTNFFSATVSVFRNVVPTVSPVSITQQPAPAQVCPTGFETFVVAATGGSPSYQWQRESPPGSGQFVNLMDGSTSAWDGMPLGIGGVVSGATTPTLTISAALA